MDELNKHYKDTAVKFDLLDIASDIPFALGNVIKYLIRAGHKEGESAENDIAKAKVYAKAHWNWCQNHSRWWSIKHKERWELIRKLLAPKISLDNTEAEGQLVRFVISHL